MRYASLYPSPILRNSYQVKVHHILAEIIQGGLVLETNVEEIDASGMSVPLPYEEFLLGS